MIKNNQREKMQQEITIHKSLNHANVVKFLSFFDDDTNVYIVLELCKQRSMMELHKRRNIVTDYECRYYISQILRGVQYLHHNRIIHRDLKLGNLLLNEQLHVKIADFGLATRIEYDGERKKTLCGTPNYIAPEILTKKGHSYEVDIWSIGCVMYTLLAGQPPFETKSLKDTYSKIRKGDYRMPSVLHKQPCDMIKAMLTSDPCKRPTVHQLAKFPFLTQHHIPESLPVTCLTCEPRLDQMEGIGNVTREAMEHRRPLIELNGGECGTGLVGGDFGRNFGLAFSNHRHTLFCFITKYPLSVAFAETRGLLSNQHDFAAGSAIERKNLEYKTDIENLYKELSKLLNNKVSPGSNFRSTPFSCLA